MTTKREFKLLCTTGGTRDPSTIAVCASYGSAASAERAFAAARRRRPDLDYELVWRGIRWTGRYMSAEALADAARSVPGATTQVSWT